MILYAFVQNISPIQSVIILLQILLLSALFVIPFWKIFSRIGYSPWLSLLAIIPFGGIILLYVIAFAPWRTTPIPASDSLSDASGT